MRNRDGLHGSRGRVKPVLAWLLALLVPWGAVCAADRARPNIVVLLADDWGFTDVGAFGGEMDTPHLDSLARNGARFSNFHVTASCSPTRSMLLTGVDNHRNGVGNMRETIPQSHMGKPGYLSVLDTNVVTVATLLRDAGYRTYVAGKWHVGKEPHNLPPQRGFDRSLVQGDSGSDNWETAKRYLDLTDKVYWYEDGREAAMPAEFYSSQYYVDRMIDYLRTDTRRSQPFFAYLAFQANHIPVQAPKEFIDRFKGRYDQGWHALRKARRDRAAALGIIPADAPMVEMKTTTDWNALTDAEKKYQARRMEVYAGMAEAMDHHVGRLMEFLRSTGEFDNTVFVFLSDNGAEGHDLNDFPEFRNWAAKFDQRLERMGRAGSFTWYGPQWAEAGTAPSRLYKGFPTEGGIHVPAFIWSAGQQAHGINRSLVSAMDVVPTLLDLAGVASGGDEFHHHKVHPIEGRTLRPVLTSTAQAVRGENDSLGWELFGRSAVRIGQWKAVQLAQVPHAPRWELYDLTQDPAEMHDLSAARPQQARELLDVWDRYVKDNHVILPNEVSGY